MKKIISRILPPIGGLILLFVLTWVFFPYFYSTKNWEAKTKFQVSKISWTTELIGTSNDFPDTKLVFFLHKTNGDSLKISYPADIKNNKNIKVGDIVYLYELRKDLPCVSKSSSLNNSIKWRYYWICDISPIKNTILFIVLLIFIMQLCYKKL